VRRALRVRVAEACRLRPHFGESRVSIVVLEAMTRIVWCFVALGAGAAAGCGSSGSKGAAETTGGTNDIPDASVGPVVDGGNGADVQTGADSASGGDDSGHPAGGGNDGSAGGPDAGPDADAMPRPVAAIPLVNADGNYVGPLGIGGQTFAMIIDTGAANTAVAGAGCTTCSSMDVSPLYTPSATGKDLNVPESLTYGDATGWTGEIFQDTVGFGHGTPDVTLAFASMSTQNGFFPDDDNTRQGDLGLGPAQRLDPTIPATAYFDRATMAGLTPVMAFELCDQTGTMWLGGYDPSAAVSAPQYTPLAIDLDFSGYSLQVSDLKIGGASLGFKTADFANLLVDTGTTFMYLQTPVYTAALNAIEASSGWASLLGAAKASTDNPGFLCATPAAGVTDAMIDAALPALTFTFPGANGGSAFSVNLPPHAYLVNGGPEYCLGLFDDGGSGPILGDSFLGALVTVFDPQHAQIGFAPDKGCSSGGIDGGIGSDGGIQGVQDHVVFPRLPRHPRHPRHPRQ
jgi:hypothetical protein